jgi:hypothetical protein
MTNTGETVDLRPVEGVLARMDMEAGRFRDAQDRHGFFACLYLATTRAIAAGIAGGRFVDAPQMVRFDVIFAGHWFRAVNARRNHDAAPSAPWAAAFAAGRDAEVFIVQHLLLGMNAHINDDLPRVVAELLDKGADPHLLYDDYHVVNDILAEMIDRVQAALNTLNPALDRVDRWLGRLDEGLFDFSIVKARAAAWDSALSLRAAGPSGSPGRAAAESALEARTAGLAQKIASAHRLLPGDGGFLRNDEPDWQDRAAGVGKVIDALRAIDPRPAGPRLPAGFASLGLD